MYDRIVVPLDGSEHAEQALANAAELARLTGAPLHLVRIIDITRAERYGPFAITVTKAAFARALQEEDVAAQAYLERVAADLDASGVEITTEIRHGSPAPALVGLTQAGDLIVMASHGRSGPARWLLGSVTEGVSRHARVPILIVRVAMTPDQTVESGQSQEA